MRCESEREMEGIVTRLVLYVMSWNWILVGMEYNFMIFISIVCDCYSLIYEHIKAVPTALAGIKLRLPYMLQKCAQLFTHASLSLTRHET